MIQNGTETETPQLPRMTSVQYWDCMDWSLDSRVDLIIANLILHCSVYDLL